MVRIFERIFSSFAGEILPNLFLGKGNHYITNNYY